jgi:malonyl-CoA decarboxylase
MADDGVLQESREGIFDRALRNLRGVWGKIARSGEDDGTPVLSPDLEGADRQRLADQMRACLDGRGGEVSARARAAALGRAYLALDETGRARFLDVLAKDFDVDHGTVAAAARDLSAARYDDARRRAEARLRGALEAPRVKLLTQFNVLPEGVKFLVDLRKELAAKADNDPALRGLETDLKTLLTSWFDVGFLELRQITWDAPASLLEKLIAYEAVHAIESWDDMKNRLASDRRCFAYFHPRMPDEPLIFVWVALVKGMAGNIQELLDESAPLEDADAADAAIFYSITNAQDGLRGISFGNFLIKRVADSLSAELPGLKTFATLSPLPGFRKWLDGRSETELEELVPDSDANALATEAKSADVTKAVRALLGRPGWNEQPDVTTVLQPVLMRLAAHYLARAKRAGGTAMDSVAHFHLSNGAKMERLNWLADTSARGLAQAAGIMVNYLYELDRIEAHHEAYSGQGVVTTSGAVADLLKN